MPNRPWCYIDLFGRTDFCDGDIPLCDQTCAATAEISSTKDLCDDQMG